MLVLAWGTLVLCAPAATRYMPIDEVKAGMTGVGRTVFQGTAIEEFKAHIIGVVRSNIGPQRDLILARLEGGPMAKTGVIAGMSGSPVYIDGRLVGAVSYSLGSFATEAIAGITPIAEMIDATTRPAAASSSRVAPIPIGADPSVLLRAFEAAIAPARPFAATAGSGAAFASSSAFDPGVAAALRPIALPLAMSGFDGGVAEPVMSVFRQAGFVAVPGAARSWPQDAPPSAGPLRPGDPVGVALITGDLQFGATGTVTEVDGNRVYAFGHPLYNVGPVSFAMTRAYVHAVLPSLSSSMKLSSIGEVVGTVQQDRATAVAGIYGTLPRTIEMTVSLRRDGGTARVFRFSLADNPLLTPLLAYTALANIFTQHEHDVGPATFALRGRSTITGHGTLEFDDVFTGDQPNMAAASAVAMPIGALMTNDKEPVRVESLHLEIDSTERLRVATIERVWLDTTDVQRGKTVPVKILLSTWRGEKIVQTVAVEIPRNAEGPLTLLVADGVRFAQWEQRENRAALTPDSVDQMVKLLNQSRRGNRLYVRLLARDSGAVVSGEAMPALPSSVLAVMQGDRGSAANPPLQTSVLGAWEIPMTQAVAGLRTLTVTLDPPTRHP
jgi:hypothetical protein